MRDPEAATLPSWRRSYSAPWPLLDLCLLLAVILRPPALRQSLTSLPRRLLRLHLSLERLHLMLPQHRRLHLRCLARRRAVHPAHLLHLPLCLKAALPLHLLHLLLCLVLVLPLHLRRLPLCQELAHRRLRLHRLLVVMPRRQFQLRQAVDLLAF